MNQGLESTTGRGRCGIASVWRTCWFDEQQVSFFFGYGTVLNTLGNDKQLTRPERDITFVHADGDASTEHEEEVVGVVVCVPNKLALDFDNHEIVTIELADNAWLPVTCE